MLKPGTSSQGHRAEPVKSALVSFILVNVQNQLMKAYIQDFSFRDNVIISAKLTGQSDTETDIVGIFTITIKIYILPKLTLKGFTVPKLSYFKNEVGKSKQT